MSINQSWNYEDILSLEKAKLVGSERQDFLGTKELVLDYYGVTHTTKADCAEWLETNRLHLTDPEFSFNTYEGYWTCISIKFIEKSSTLRQTFMIDSSIGNLGDIGDEPVYADQTGDLSRSSDGMSIVKAYYWRISDPASIVLPAPIEGQIWTKTSNNNGDSTYDVIVSREIENNLSGFNNADNYAFSEVTLVDTNQAPIAVPTASVGKTESVTNTPQENGLYRTTSTTRTAKEQTAINGARTAAFTETTDISTNDDEQRFTDDVPAGTVALPLAGETKTISNTPLDNGKYRTAVTTRTAISQDATSYSKVGGETSAGMATDSIFVYQSFDPLANGEYTFTSGIGPNKFFDGAIVSPIETRVWTNSNNYTTSFVGSAVWTIADATSTLVHSKVGLNLNSFGWSPDVIVQVGANPPLYTETVEVDTSATEASFVSDLGSVPDPIIGQEKTISNTILADGSFRVTVTTRTMNYQRIPALEDSMIFGGDGVTGENLALRDRNAFVWGKNATYEEYQFDLNFMTNNKNSLSNSQNASLNKWGLYDYTIRSTEI